MKKIKAQICKVVIFSLLFSFCSSVYSQSLRINEFMALNQKTLADEDGDFSDWIEVYNPSETAVNLLGWALTDNISQPFKWLFPNVTLPAGDYLMVFASSKNRNIAGKELHTNFNLSGGGEYLALRNPMGVVSTEFNPSFPVQQTDFSFGFYNGEYIAFSVPTPGKENQLSPGSVIPEPEFSIKHGFYDSPFQLEITTTYPNAAVYYTTDGSIPTKSSGTLYSSGINISKTTIIRAVVVAAGATSGKVATQSYIFTNDVIHQPNNPVGYPSAWGPYTAISGNAVADYEMDPDMMKDANFAASVREALSGLPTISLVTDKSNLFSSSTDPETGGIYIYTGAPITNTTYALGRDWERPVSFEYFDTNKVSFQLNCGIRLQGGHGRRPEKSPKHSFLLVFDSSYGLSSLNYPIMGKGSVEKFDNLILRAGFGNSWVHQDNAQRIKALYQQDIWTKDTQRAMGQPAGNSGYAHVYINGIYWGVYAPSERMDKEFAASYLGGDKDEYDVIKDYAEVSDGNIQAWDKMMAMANAGLETNEKYQLIQGKNPDGSPSADTESLVDVVNLADYMLLNFYGGNTDWDHHNWSAMRNRVNPGKGFKFLCWDAEMVLGTLNTNVLSENNENCPSRVYQQLLQNADFKRLLADRIQKHCYNEGALTPNSAAKRWLERKAQIENPILAESARWGDYRRDVHPYVTTGPFSLYTKEDNWLPQQSYTLNTYFPQRTSVFINQLRDAGLFPTVDAPVFYINNKYDNKDTLTVGDKLSMTCPNGSIYYTTNGTDPVDWKTGNSTSAMLYTQAVSISQSAHIKARTLYNGQWSAVNSRFLVIPKNYPDIKITEIHYHPSGDILFDNGEYEFLELKNTGSSTLNLGGLKFTEGIDYVFPNETQLGPSEFVVLASNSNCFYSRYKFRPFAVYNGKLDNDGEWIVLQTQSNDTIAAVNYNNGGVWPALADGVGYSLVPVVYNPANNQANPSDWRSSYRTGGSPGADDTPLSELPAHKGSTSDGIELAPNFPNPFAEQTTIGYRIPENAGVQLTVFNLLGLQIADLVNAYQTKGYHGVVWKGLDQNNRAVPNGIYFYRLSVRTGNDSYVYSRKLVLRK